MSKELFMQALIKFTLGVLLVGLLVFLSAGTTDFWNGWLFMGILFIPMFLAGLNYRFQWYMLPKPVSIGAAVIFLLAYALWAEVLRENTYLSRTIEV